MQCSSRFLSNLAADQTVPAQTATSFFHLLSFEMSTIEGFLLHLWIRVPSSPSSHLSLVLGRVSGLLGAVLNLQTAEDGREQGCIGVPEVGRKLCRCQCYECAIQCTYTEMHGHSAPLQLNPFRNLSILCQSRRSLSLRLCYSCTS
jgi:hypothetical protein